MKVENDPGLSWKKLNRPSHSREGWYEIPIVRCWHFFLSSTGSRVHRVREARIHMRYWEYAHTSVSLYCGNNGFPGSKGELLEAPGEAYEFCPYCEIKAIALGLPSSIELLGHQIALARIQPRKRIIVSEPKQNKPTEPIMNKTAIIMSEAEAMALPQSKRPLCFRVPSKIYHDVFETVGAASMCWKPKPEGVFDSSKASDFAVELCFKIAEELERLGVTTEMMRDVAPESKPDPERSIKCETCQSEATIHIDVVGWHFCEPCLKKIDERLKS